MTMQAVSNPEDLGFDPDRLKRIDAWMQRNIDDGRFSGSSVVVARQGKIAHLSCAGQRSMAKGAPYEADTIVRIYSMTKMITTIGLMMLSERGLIHLDEPLDSVLPEFSECQAMDTNGKDLISVPAPTLHQLLTHTSGMSYGFNVGPLAELYAANKIGFAPGTSGLESEVKKAAAMPLAFVPGTRWEYSIGIDVIGRVIEVVSGKSLDQYLKEEILDPLEMVDTGFFVPDSKRNRFADCYFKADYDPLHLLDSADASEFGEGQVNTFSGGGGLVSTLGDYFRFGEMIRLGGALDGVRLVSPRTLAFMQRNHLAGEISSMGPSSFAEMPMDGMGFGLGGAVVLDPARARMIGSVGDFGWGGMASTFFWTDPVENLTCIYFTQLVPSSSYPNRAELKALVHGALLK